MVMFVSMLALLVAVGAIMAATPWFMRKTECFTVTVPAAAVDDARLLGYKRCYAGMVLGGTAVLAVASVVAGALWGWDAAGFWTVVAGVLIMSFAPFLLMLAFRNRVRVVKEAEGWRAEGRVSIAAIGERELPRPLSLAWELIHVPVAVLTVVLSLTLMPSMPDRVPIHFNAAGVADGWADKGPSVVLIPLIAVVFMAACMAFAHASILFSKRGVAAETPAVSSYAYAVYARAQSIFIVALGLLLNGSFALLPLTMAGLLPMGAWTFVTLLAVAVAIAGEAVFLVRYGQNGSRLAKRLDEAQAQGVTAEDVASMRNDEDAYWKAGVFYVNRADPAIFLPKRFGIGWTVNFGNPLAWAVMLGIVVISVAFVVVMGMLS